MTHFWGRRAASLPLAVIASGVLAGCETVASAVISDVVRIRDEISLAKASATWFRLPPTDCLERVRRMLESRIEIKSVGVVSKNEKDIHEHLTILPIENTQLEGESESGTTFTVYFYVKRDYTAVILKANTSLSARAGDYFIERELRKGVQEMVAVTSTVPGGEGSASGERFKEERSASRAPR